MNKVIIIGRLGTDPDTRVTQSGSTVCSFSVAVNGRRGGEETTTWFRVSAWNKLGENCQRYLAKGKLVGVVGSIGASAYKDRNGDARASLEINAHEVEFLMPRQNERPEQTDAPDNSVQQNEYVPVDDDELPF